MKKYAFRRGDIHTCTLDADTLQSVSSDLKGHLNAESVRECLLPTKNSSSLQKIFCYFWNLFLRISPDGLIVRHPLAVTCFFHYGCFAPHDHRILCRDSFGSRIHPNT